MGYDLGHLRAERYRVLSVRERERERERERLYLFIKSVNKFCKIKNWEKN